MIQWNYKYIYPPNAREQEQLDIMIKMEAQGKDPMALDVIDQEILFTTEFWYVSENRFPYKGAKKQFLIVALGPIYSIEEMSAEMWGDLLVILKKLKEEYQIEGGGFCFRFGDPALSGASLTRLHAHVIMPEEEGGVRFKIGGHRELKEGLVIKEDIKE